ncbi:MAG: cysteine desulfurase [Candidatus Aenigmarchaeota archaeon]|nr:cysteine desulfurase [Candidatus Aenigmarchaeota archaeon]
MLIDEIRNDFPILKRKVNGKPLVYLDNAATSQKPKQVIDAIKNFYETQNANIHRGIHQLSEESTEAFERSREKVAKFISAKPEQIIFTKNTTESINTIAYGYGLKNIKKGDEILTTVMEHHSNFLPWQLVKKHTGATLKIADITDDGLLKMNHLEKLATKKTKLVAVTQVSNVLGTINPVKEISEIAQKNNSLFLVDGAQAAPHMPVDVKKTGCDFYAFSSHKMLGPTGIGVLYIKDPDKVDPFLVGGGTIKEVYTDKEAVWHDSPWKFEGGTPDVSGVIGFGATVDYLNKIGMEKIRKHEEEITKYALDKLLKIKNITIYGPMDHRLRGAVIAFNIGGIHPHDVAAILDSEGIAVRPGHACCKPLMSRLDILAMCRASFYIYNTKNEADVLVSGLEKVNKIFKR